MTLRHLEIFKAVSETGSFTKAADILHITQSGVSHAIRELEDRAGVALFDRLSKRVSLTSAGKLLLAEAAPILASCEALEAHMDALEKDAPVRVASSITIAAFWLPGILKELKKDRPDTPVEVEVVSAANAVEILRRGETDLALVEGVPPQGPFLSEPFSSYELVVLCSPDYPAAHKPLTFQELCGERLLLREPGSAIRDVFDSRLYLQGYTVRPSWTSVNSLALTEAAKAGLGITILPRILVQDALSLGTLVTLSVEGLRLENQLLVLRRRDKYITAAAESLLSILRRFGCIST